MILCFYYTIKNNKEKSDYLFMGGYLEQLFFAQHLLQL